MKPKRQLTDQQFRITQLGETEPPFSGAYVANKEPGIHRCVVCDTKLFSSKAKYGSGTGWPSFWEAVDKKNLKVAKDDSQGIIHTEAKCDRCRAHLGHLFDNGPRPTGQRYCINSAA